MGLSSVAQKLQRSLRNGDPANPDWFADALTVALDRQIGLDQVIWDAVRELLNQRQGRKAA